MEAARNLLLTFARPGQQGRYRGSGFHLRGNLVLTADHCADGEDYHVWWSANDLPGRVVWRSDDANADLALLEVEGLPEVDPVPLAVLDTATGGVLDNCTSGCYPSFGRLDPVTQGASSGPDRLVPLTGNLLLDSAYVARIPDGWVPDGRIALSLTSDRSLLPDARGAAHEVTEAWSAASGGAVLVIVGGRQFCVGVISARQVKETPTALRVAGFDLLDKLDPVAAAGFWDKIGVPGLAGLTSIGRTVRAEQVVVGQIPRRAPEYVDRDVTAGLVERIADSSTVTLLSLAGLRGVGKSQAASGVARHCVEQGWPVVAWVNAETRDSVVSDLRLLAERLGAVVQGEPPVDSVQRLYSLWAGDRVTWRLVVFDNLVDRHDLDGLLPPEASAAVIATTADRSVVVGDVLDVGVFTLEQALAYMEAGTAMADPNGASRVARELGRLPLALAGAVWTIARRRRLDHGYGYDQYVQELERQPLDRLLGNDKATPGYPRATVAALALAVETAMDAADDRELARSMLGALAFLDPAGVPRRWFDALGETFDVDDALVVIADSGLAQPSDDTTSVIMHRLVARVVRDLSDRDGWSSQAMAGAADLVEAVRPLDLEDYWAQRAEAVALATHILALLADSDRGVNEQVVVAGVLAGHTLNELSDPYTTITVLRPLSASAERVLGADHPETLASRNNLAHAYQAAGDLGRAIPLFEETLADRQRVLGPDHPNTLRSRNNLAYTYKSAGELRRAISLYEETLADRERILGAEHPDTLISRNNLADAYQAAGDLGRTIPLHRATLVDTERVLGADHPNTFISRNNLAGAYQTAGDLRRAIPLYEATVADAERVLGADHPHTLTSRNNLAQAYQSAGDLARAIPLHEATLADRERILGADHPGTLTTRNNVAYVYEAAGDLTRAIVLYEGTLADRQRILGAGHPDTLASRNNLAHAYQLAGELGRAVRLYEATVADSERFFGGDHSHTLSSRHNLAHAYLAAGDLGRAIPLHEATLADRERILGADHPDTRATRNNLAHAYVAVGELRRAIPLHEATLSDRERILGADHPDTLTSRNNVACAYEAAGDLGRAVRLFEVTLADRERILGTDHPHTLTSRNNLAHAYQSAGDLGRAIPLFEASLADYERVLGADQPDTLTSRGNLVLALAEDGAGERALSLAHLNVGEGRRLFGAEDSRTLHLRDTVANVLLVAGCAQEAKDLLTDLLADCHRILGDHAVTRTVEQRLANATSGATT